MKTRGYDFVRANKLKAARSEDADYKPAASKKETPAVRPVAAVSARPASARPASDRPVKGKHTIVPIGQMPNGTIKATVNEVAIYISATANPTPRGMAATYRLAGKYFGLSADEYAKLKADCPTPKTPTEAELALRKVKIMFAHAETLVENQGEYFRTIHRAEQARADWEAKYSDDAKKKAATLQAKAITKKWASKRG